MTSTVQLFPDKASIQSFAFDITKSETHSFESTLTKNPIENGSTVTDQVIVAPARFVCVVGISNTPVETTAEHEGLLGPITINLPGYPPSQVATDLLFPSPVLARSLTVQGFKIANPVDRVKRMLDRLNILRTTVQTLTIVTSKHTYDSMVLTKIDLPIEKEHYGEFTLTFEELIVVSTDQVTAPKPKEPRGAPTTDHGASDPTKDAISQGEKMFSDFFSGKTSILRTGAIAVGG